MSSLFSCQSADLVRKKTPQKKRILYVSGFGVSALYKPEYSTFQELYDCTVQLHFYNYRFSPSLDIKLSSWRGSQHFLLMLPLWDRDLVVVSSH